MGGVTQWTNPLVHHMATNAQSHSGAQRSVNQKQVLIFGLWEEPENMPILRDWNPRPFVSLNAMRAEQCFSVAALQRRKTNEKSKNDNEMEVYFLSAN